MNQPRLRWRNVTEEPIPFDYEGNYVRILVAIEHPLGPGYPLHVDTFDASAMDDYDPAEQCDLVRYWMPIPDAPSPTS